MIRRRFNRLRDGVGIYRSRNGIILGVCRGLAEYFDFKVAWVRIIAFILLLFTGFWPVGVIYLVAALLMKPEPVIAIHSDEEQEFYDSYVHSSRQAVNRLKRKYQNLKRRIQRMEDIVTSPEFDWEDRYRR